MSTVFQKFAAALLPFFVLVIGALTTVIPAAGESADWSALLQFAILILGAVVTFIVPLVAGKWSGILKTGVSVLAVILAALIPFVLPGGFNPETAWPVIVVAVLNAIATELGVQIRLAPANSAGTVPDPASVKVAA